MKNNPIFLCSASLLILMLAGCGSDVQVSESEAGTPGAVATEQGTPESTRSAGVKADPLLVPLFMEAALNGDAETIGNALEAGTDSNILDDEGRTALMLAAFNGHTKVVGMLLDGGARINQRESMNRTALMFASTGPNSATVKLLLEHKADVNLVDGGEHWSALMFAAAEGQEDVVRLLLKHGADPGLADADGDTAESFAMKNGHMVIAELLKEASAHESSKP